MLVPLYGFVQGDPMGLVVLAHDDMTLAEVADKLRASAALRVDGADFCLVHAGAALDPRLTVAAAGLHPLDRIDLRRPESP